MLAADLAQQPPKNLLARVDLELSGCRHRSDCAVEKGNSFGSPLRDQNSAPGEWPADFPFNEDGDIEEGLVVWPRLEIIEGRTTGNRRRCESYGCPGWFIGVELGVRALHPIPVLKGLVYNPVTKMIRITDGGEISARAATPPPPGTDPTPRYEWPDRSALSTRLGWRITGTDLA